MKTTLAQRRQLDAVLLRDMAALERAGIHPNAALLASRYWPSWGKSLGLSGGSFLGLVNRQLESLKIEGWVSDRIYPHVPGSKARAWGLSDKGLSQFGLRRGAPPPPPRPPPSAGARHGQGPSQPGSGGTSGQATSANRPDQRPEVPRQVYEAAVLLGVSPLSSPDEVDLAYRRWAKSLHPDRNPNPQDSAEFLKRINHARDLVLEFARSRLRR